MAPNDIIFTICKPIRMSHHFSFALNSDKVGNLYIKLYQSVTVLVYIWFTSFYIQYFVVMDHLYLVNILIKKAVQCIIIITDIHNII